MPKPPAKADWEIAIEKMAATIAASAAEADARADARDAKADARAAEADKRADARDAKADKRAAKFAAEMKARDVKFAAEMKARDVKFAAEMKARDVKFAAEMKARAAEFAEEMKARDAEAKAAAEARAKKFAEEMKVRDAKVDKEMAWLRSLVGGYITDDGEMLEQDVVAAVISDMSLDGIRFNRVITNSHVHDPSHGDGEFDWIGINGKITVVGETRRTLERGDARYFFHDRLELFRRAFPKDAEGKEVRGAMIYQKAKKGAVEEALKLQMMVFCAEGDKTLRPVKTPGDIHNPNETKTHKRPRKSA